MIQVVHRWIIPVSYTHLDVYKRQAYRQKHESDFIIADAAARYFRENGISKLPSYKSLQAAIESLIKEKNSGYNDCLLYTSRCV